MLLVPVLLAVGASGQFGLPGLLWISAALASFCARSPALALLRVRGRGHGEVPALHDASLAAGYIVLALLGGGAVLVVWNRWTLLVFAALTLAGALAYGLAYWARWDRAFGWQVIFVVALTQTGPSVYVAETGRLWPEGLALWGLAVAHFTVGLLYVHLRLRELRESRASPSDRWRLVVVAAVSVAAVILASFYHLAPPASAVALLPALARALHLAAFGSFRKTTLKSLGREELWMALAFGGLGLVAFLLTPQGWYVLT
jgi:hypothetical protein